jgi:hypothetical protein
MLPIFWPKHNPEDGSMDFFETLVPIYQLHDITFYEIVILTGREM